VTAPRHVAIIMDGNGRWASGRGLPRSAGHRAGLKPVRMCVEQCLRHSIGMLTLFAFSSENWHRPSGEVGFLMNLFLETLEREIEALAGQGVAVRFIGERSGLGAEIVARMATAETLAPSQPKLRLNVALNYGGRWDIVAAARRLAAAAREGRIDVDAIDEPTFGKELSLAENPDPDLLIRTGGEQRVSNFLLWNLAYTELWFTEILWPAFDASAFEAALGSYATRQRRFGRVDSAGT
jgi:undecaprenyl diphosphate synthase